MSTRSESSEPEYGEICLFGFSIIKWRRRFKYPLKIWTRTTLLFKLLLRNARLGKKVRSLRKKFDDAESAHADEMKRLEQTKDDEVETADSRLNQEIQARKMAEADLEIAKAQITQMAAWQEVELERLKKEATMHSIQRHALYAVPEEEGLSDDD